MLMQKLQQELDNQGFSVGSIDGVYGAQTRKALKACIADKCILSM